LLTEHNPSAKLVRVPPLKTKMKVNINRRQKSIGRGTSLRSGRLGRIFARYRDARKSMRVSISRQSQRGLDWMNFFLADVQTGFGAFVAFYLADLGWPKGWLGAHRWHAGWRPQPGPGRGACRCNSVETRVGRDRHWHDLRVCPGICARAKFPARVLGRDPAWPRWRDCHTCPSGNQSWSRWSPRDVKSNWSELPIRRIWQCVNGGPDGISRTIFCQERDILRLGCTVHPRTYFTFLDSPRRD
jgi:hypothetical protein